MRTVKEIERRYLTWIFWACSFTTGLYMMPITIAFIKPEIFQWYHYAFIAIALIIAWSLYGITRYRMHKGYFGNNELEARQLIDFINRSR